MTHVCGCLSASAYERRVGLRLREAVHEEPRAERGDDDERHPHQAGVGEVHLVHGQLHGRGRHADDDHERHEQLRRRRRRGCRRRR